MNAEVVLIQERWVELERAHVDASLEEMAQLLRQAHWSLKHQNQDVALQDGAMLTDRIKSVLRAADAPYCEGCGEFTPVSELDEHDQCVPCRERRLDADEEPDEPEREDE